MNHRSIKDALYAGFAPLGKALSSPRRLEIIDLLAQGELSVEQLAGKADLGVGNTSAHLKTLASAGLVGRRRAGQRVFYSLAGPQVFELFRRFQGVAEARIAEVNRIVERHYEAPGELEPITANELMERMRNGDVLLLDVRPIDEFQSGHIAGAVPLPLDELEKGLGNLPSDKEIVAYCRGRYCLFAVEAVQALRARGLDARRLEVGFPDWRMLGLPVAGSRRDDAASYKSG